MFRLFTCVLSVVLFCSNILPASTQTVAQPQQQEAAAQNPVENFLNFNGPQNLEPDKLGSELQKTNVSLEKIANSLSQFTLERITFSVLSTLFFTAGLCFMYHSHKIRTPLPIPPITRLQDIIKLQAKYFLVNDVLSKGSLFFLFGIWALTKVHEEPAKKQATPAIPVVAPVAAPAQA